MVNRFLFKDRNGRTPLPEEFKRGLIPRHIQTGAELDEFEEENIVDGLVWLEDFKGDYKDWMFWARLHKELFGKVWKWAGKFRAHELQNEDFNHPGYIQQNIKLLEGDLQYWLEEAVAPDKKEFIARFHERFLTIHPFTNGNGRTSRILTEYICKRATIPIPTWGEALRTDAKMHRSLYIAAILKARKEHDFSALMEFMFQ